MGRDRGVCQRSTLARRGDLYAASTPSGASGAGRPAASPAPGAARAPRAPAPPAPGASGACATVPRDVSRDGGAPQRQLAGCEDAATRAAITPCASYGEAGIAPVRPRTRVGPRRETAGAAGPRSVVGDGGVL